MSIRLHVNESRAVLAIAGEEAIPFLQDLVTNDVRRLAPEGAIYAGLLTPQGKLLVDFLLLRSDGNSLLADLPAASLADTTRRLAMYRLRRKVEWQPRPDLRIGCAFGGDAAALAGLPPTPGAGRRVNGQLVVVDPRSAALGLRICGPRPADALPPGAWREADSGDWRRHRIGLGVPEGEEDLPPGQLFPLEAGFDALNGVDHGKGCYVGQEVTARMRHRTTLRRGIRRVRIEGPPPAPGTEIRADGKPAGTLLSSTRDGRALAHLRLDRAAAGELRAGDQRLAWAGDGEDSVA